jgi:phage terminase large subunit-like protein
VSKYPHVEKAENYIKDVLSGDVSACKWVRLACERHKNDYRLSQKSDNYSFYYSPKHAEKACKFIEMMPHTKGKWAAKGLKLILEPWQCFFICMIFGWLRRSDDFRRFRKAQLFVPRKNGKSALAGAIGLYMLTADGEYGAEVYSGATTERQAQEVFTPAYYMTKRNEQFKDFFGVEVSGTHKNPTAIYLTDNGSKFMPIIGKPGDGSSPHCAIIDEYHEHKTDEQVDTMETGMGAREQPLLLVITTAGSNIAGPCYQMQLDAQKMLEGTQDDESTFALIYTVDKGDPWDHPDTLRKANPNFGVSVGEDFLMARLADAKNNPRKQTIFKTKHLDMWVGAKDAYFNTEQWQSLGDESLKLEDFKGYQAYLGMDLASKYDISALEILIPLGNGDYVEFGKYYLPEETINSTSNEHYRGWVATDKLTKTEGALIDYEHIKQDIISLCKMLNVVELAYDPYQATMLITSLMDEGVPVVETRQSIANLSEPMKELEAKIRAGQIRHPDNPCMAWMISNVVASTNAKDEVYPRKERDEAKIDGPVALILAFGRAMIGGPPDIGGFISDPIKVTYK